MGKSEGYGKALLQAVIDGNVEIAESILKLGAADLFGERDKLGRGVMGCLFCSRKLDNRKVGESAGKILAIAPDAISEKDTKGRSLMMLVAMAGISGRIGMVHKLDGQALAEKNAREGDMTALMYAAHYEKPGAISEILALDPASAHARDRQGRTALMTAVLHCGAVKDLLAEAPACVNDRDDEGRTALMHAAGNYAANYFIGALLDAGADPLLKANGLRASDLCKGEVREMLREAETLREVAETKKIFAAMRAPVPQPVP